MIQCDHLIHFQGVIDFIKSWAWNEPITRNIAMSYKNVTYISKEKKREKNQSKLRECLVYVYILRENISLPFPLIFFVPLFIKNHIDLSKRKTLTIIKKNFV